MKTIRSFIGLVGCGLALAMVSSLYAQTETQGAAKVVRIKGSARVSVSGGAWQPLHVGDLVKPGSVIQTSTEDKSYVDIVLGEGEGATPIVFGASGPPSSSLGYQPEAAQNVVRIYANTALGVDKLTTMDTGAGPVSDTQLDLKAGHIFGSVKKMSAASKYEVKIPNGVAGIRGTTYDLTSDGVIRVTVGSVVLAYVDSSGKVVTQVIVAGQQFDARTQTLSPIPTSIGDQMNDTAKATEFITVAPITYITVNPSLYNYVSPSGTGP
ncbi:conserved exported hypothetical protein [Verrucomicrobia bacterium]|nr:conserved exported hypothetical protein [Verrucomicrobiota bacterium]